MPIRETITDDNDRALVLSWASDREDDTLDQAARVARMPFVQKPLALMSDAHLGVGATIGSVIATKGAVIPSAVGVDLGCGVSAVETPFTSADLPDNLDGLHDLIRAAVPAGKGKGHAVPQNVGGAGVAMLDRADAARLDMTPSQRQTAMEQLGSLGGGNHFVEVCLDERDHVWIMLHSGSRGIGNQLASEHIENAKGVMRSYFIELDDPALAYLVEGTPEFDRYIAAMLWSQDYAAANRDVMLANTVSAFKEFLGRDFEPVDTIRCHHNFCEREHHRGTNLWVTRKGAIRAREGDRGIIPGSMGTRSYIVEGLGNAASFNSSSHGAGRRMSRGAARKQFNVAGLTAQMAGQSWNESEAADLLDEDPRSYKSIDQVMADQADLVRPVHTLGQILNFKGAK